MHPASPCDAPIILGAPSVVMLASLDQSKSNSSIVWHTLQNISSPVVVSVRLCRAASSLDTSNINSPNKISSCAVSYTSLLSSIANAKHSKSLAFPFSWTCTLCPISSICLVTVDADRLTVFRASFLSGHTSFKHFLTNSPSLNKFPQLAISLATLKLARMDDRFICVWCGIVLCWASTPHFGWATFSLLTSPSKLAYCPPRQVS